MAKKSSKTTKNSNSLFEDNDIIINEKQKKTRKNTKTDNDNNNNNNNSNISKLSGKLLDNDKKPQNLEKNGSTKSKKDRNANVRKQSDVKESIHKGAGKRGKGKSNCADVSTTIDEKPKRKSRKSKNDSVEVQKEVIIKEEKEKSGPKKWKLGYYPNSEDQLVWVEEIGHWVSKSAFTQTDPKKPVYTKDNYVQGLDSYYVMFIYKPIEKDNSHIYENLAKANKTLKRKYKTWKELSEHPNLSEDFVTEYKDYINWTAFLYNNSTREFSKAFRKKFHEKFLILVTLIK